ncbi:MAG TPA: hypothetical protein VER36_09130 [Flavisolibacter sp.]|nr:hypothetical protein [Flavisolibacter sp.]
MRLTLTVLLLSFLMDVCAQDDLQRQAAEITREGKKLYQSEMASWYGTDVFLEKFKQYRNSFSAYFSYTDTNGAHCVFYSKDESPKVLATISFDSTYNPGTAIINGQERDFTPAEKELYILRKTAVSLIESDSLFRRYKSTNFNIVPLVEGRSKKVYVLTGTSQNNVVMFGNDYLLTFDKENKLVAKRALHKSLIPVGYGKQEGQDVVGAMHSHLPEMGELMTATDVCTLMLYQKLTNWKQHVVVSANFVSIWDAQKSSLLALTMDAWKKISNHK